MTKVSAAILMYAGKVLIAKRKSNDKLADKWEFPGGKIESGETPEECLKREMKEEFGVDVTVGRCLGENKHRYDHGWIHLCAYRVYWQAGRIDVKDHAEIRWVPPDQLHGYDFAPADIPFAEKMMEGKIRF